MEDFVQKIIQASKELQEIKPIPSLDKIVFLESKMLPPGSVMLSPDLYELIEKAFPNKKE